MTKPRSRRQVNPVIKKASEMTRPELMWVTTALSPTLHAPTLNEYETEMLTTQGMYFGGELLCGRMVDEVDLPGPRSAKVNPRCSACCRDSGYPRGIGSPINDAEIRVLIGLDKPPEWEEHERRVEQVRALCERWASRRTAQTKDQYLIGSADLAETVLSVLGMAPAEEEEDLAAS